MKRAENNSFDNNPIKQESINSQEWESLFRFTQNEVSWINGQIDRESWIKYCSEKYILIKKPIEAAK